LCVLVAESGWRVRFATARLVGRWGLRGSRDAVVVAQAVAGSLRCWKGSGWLLRGFVGADSA
jgi:hypothetical protein